MRLLQRTPGQPASSLAPAAAARRRGPFLPLFATAILASLTLAASTAHAADCTGANLLPALASVPTAKAATLCLLNHERAARGLLPLSPEATLESAATSYAQTMVQQRFFGHVSPGGQTITDRLASYVGPALDHVTGENLAWGEGAFATPSAIVKQWMDSEGHRANILNRNFEQIGVGIVGGTPSGGLPAVSATYTTEFGARTLGSSGEASPVRASASPVRASASSAPPAAPVPAGTSTTKTVSAKKKQQISKRCHRVARRTKGSRKTRTTRYDRCMRKELRAAAS